MDWERASRRLPALIRESALDADCASGGTSAFSDMFEEGDEFYLEPEGAAFIFNTYDSSMWECNTIRVDKGRLLKIGARPDFWKP